MACLSHIISKLLQVVWHFVVFFLLFLFFAYSSHNFSIFVVSGCRIWTLNHVNRHKSFARELFRKFNLTNSNGFSVYTLCHLNYNNKKKKTFLAFQIDCQGIKIVLEKSFYFMCFVSVECFCELNLFNPIKQELNNYFMLSCS